MTGENWISGLMQAHTGVLVPFLATDIDRTLFWAQSTWIRVRTRYPLPWRNQKRQDVTGLWDLTQGPVSEYVSVLI